MTSAKTKRKKKKERKRIGKHRLIIFASIIVTAAAVFLLGFSFFYNASDKEVTGDVADTSSGKQIIKDVSFSFKTPDVAHWWNSFVDHVNTFTDKTKEEAEDLANKREQKKKEKQSASEVNEEDTEEVVSESEEVTVNDTEEHKDEEVE